MPVQYTNVLAIKHNFSRWRIVANSANITKGVIMIISKKNAKMKI